MSGLGFSGLGPVWGYGLGFTVWDGLGSDAYNFYISCLIDAFFARRFKIQVRQFCFFLDSPEATASALKKGATKSPEEMRPPLCILPVRE